MLDFTLKVVKELAGYYPALVPCIFVFYLKSYSSVLALKAVQRIPLQQLDSDGQNGESGDRDIKKSNTYNLRHIILWALVVILLVGLLIGPDLFKDVSQATQLKILYFCVQLAPTMLDLPVGLFVISGVDGHAIGRNGEGKIVSAQYEIKDLGRARLPLSIFLGFSSALLALWFELRPAILVVYMSILYYFSKPSYETKKTTFRLKAWYVLITIVYVAIPTTLFVAYKPAIPIVFGLHANGESSIVQWRTIWLSAISLCVPSSMLSILLRFDYTNSLPSNYVEPVRKETTGCRISCWRMKAFPRPYYTVAFIAFGGSFVGVAVLSVQGFLKCTFENVGFLVSGAAIPVMFVAALLQALVKGELRKLWIYEEDWTAIPEVNQEDPDCGDLSDEQKEGPGGELLETRLSFDADRETMAQDDAV